MKTNLKPTTALLLLSGVVLTLCALIFFNLPNLEEAQNFARTGIAYRADHPVAAFVAVVLAHGIGLAFFLPVKALLTLFAGALLGVVWGTVATVLGVTLGTTLFFFAARRLVGQTVSNRLKNQAKEIEYRISTHPIRAMIGLRLCITLPYAPITLAAAISSMRFHHFIIGTVVGDLPVVALYALAGKQIFQLTSLNEAVSPEAAAVLMAIGITFFVSVFLGKRSKLFKNV